MNDAQYIQMQNDEEVQNIVQAYARLSSRIETIRPVDMVMLSAVPLAFLAKVQERRRISNESK